jgi:hypothetical protein
MVLMVLALGSMAENDRLDGTKNWAEQYAKPAFEMLPMVVAGNDLTSVQSLLLFAYINL